MLGDLSRHCYHEVKGDHLLCMHSTVPPWLPTAVILAELIPIDRHPRKFLYATGVQRIHPITIPPEESNEPLGDVIHIIFKVAIQNDKFRFGRVRTNCFSENPLQDTLKINPISKTLLCRKQLIK